MLFHKKTVLYQACAITLVVTLFQVFNEFTGKSVTLITIGLSLSPYTILDFTLAAMFWFSIVSRQATSTGLFHIAVLVANDIQPL